MQADVYFEEIKYFKTEQTIGYSLSDFFSKLKNISLRFVLSIKIRNQCIYAFMWCYTDQHCYIIRCLSSVSKEEVK